MRLGLGLALLGVCLWTAPAFAKGGVSCDAFLDKLRTAAGEQGVDFSHALVVSRARYDTDVFDITTKVDIDGTLTCRAGAMVRFEATMSKPAPARAAAAFESFQAAAMRSALGWDAAKSREEARDMTADVRDYLKASRERADIYVSGKTEEHAPGGIGLGLIETDTESVFIIVGQ